MTTVIENKIAVKPVESASLVAPEKAPVVKKVPAVKAAPVKAPVVKAPVVKAVATKVAAPKSVAKQPEKPVSNAVESVKASAKKPVAVVEKLKKAKLIRDSFTIPEDEYAVLSDIKKSLLAGGIEAKKSQLLRVGLVLLKKATDAELKKQLADLSPLKAGRPKKEK